MLLGQHLVFGDVLLGPLDHAATLLGLTAAFIWASRGDRVLIRATRHAAALLRGTATILAAGHITLTTLLFLHESIALPDPIRAGSEGVALILRHRLVVVQAGSQLAFALGFQHSAAHLLDAAALLEGTDVLLAFALLVGVLLVRVGEANLLLKAARGAVSPAGILFAFDLAAGLECAARDRSHAGLHVRVKRFSWGEGRAVDLGRRGGRKAFCLVLHRCAQSFGVHCVLLEVIRRPGRAVQYSAK